MLVLWFRDFLFRPWCNALLFVNLDICVKKSCVVSLPPFSLANLICVVCVVCGQPHGHISVMNALWIHLSGSLG